MTDLGYKLAGNPIAIRHQVGADAKEFNYRVLIDDTAVFEGTGVPVGGFAEIEISDIVGKYVQSSAPAVSDEYLVKADGFTRKFYVDFDSEVVEYEGTIVYGGISKYLHRMLAERGTNIFGYKYLNRNACNYALTTRTFSKQLFLRESEIAPLLIAYSGEELMFLSQSGKNIVIPAATVVPGFYYINTAKIIYGFFTQKNELIRYINILTNRVYSFSIGIIPSARMEEKYVLEFRNSLGAYERIELSGRAQSESKWEEENIYDRFDPAVCDFVENRQRTLSTETIKCECGYKSREELFFIRDLIASDDIRILGPDGMRAKVHVIADEYAVYGKMTEPQSIPLQVRFCEKEAYFLPNIFAPDSAGDTEFGTGWLKKGFWNAVDFVISDSPWISTSK